MFGKLSASVVFAALFLGLSATCPGAQQISSSLRTAEGAVGQSKYPQCLAPVERCAGDYCQKFWEHWGSRGDCLRGECHIANTSCYEELLQDKTL